MLFCNNCGAQLDEGKNFCPKCGAKAGGAPKAAHPRPSRKVLFAAAAVMIAAAAAVLVVRGQGGGGKSASETNPADFLTEVNDGTVTIAGYVGTGQEVVIPKKINNLPVAAIGEGAFEEDQLTGVTIPDSVTAIGQSAFEKCQLTSVTIPNSVTSIGQSAFANCQLTAITIPNSVTSIRAFTFSDNQLTSVTIPNSVKAIGRAAFQGNPLTTVSIPDSVTEIGAFAFWSKGLTGVEIPNSVTSIGAAAFDGDQLTSVRIGGNVSLGVLESFTFNGNLVQEGNPMRWNSFSVYYNGPGRKAAGTYVWNGSGWSNSSGNTATESAAQNFQPTHYCTENLRLRQSASTSAASITTLPQGTRVQVLQTGGSMTVDGITAPWAQVQTADGYAGWCFSGYLREQ